MDDTDLGPWQSTGVCAGVPGPGGGVLVMARAAAVADGCGDRVGMVGSVGGTDVGGTECGLGSGDGAADCGDRSGNGVLCPPGHSDLQHHVGIVSFLDLACF